MKPTNLLPICVASLYDGIRAAVRHCLSVGVRDLGTTVWTTDQSESPTNAVQKIIMWRQPSLMVTQKDDVVGLNRLADLYDEVARQTRTTDE
jgi:hypothetical protein